MFTALRFNLSAAALLCTCTLSAQSSPAIGGFVTRPGTSTDYFVNEVHVVCVPGKTESLLMTNSTSGAGSVQCPQRRLGESVTVYGKKDHKDGTITATRVDTDLPVEIAVKGLALVDRVLVPPQNGNATLRADGYPLLITPTTKCTFAQDSALTLENVGTNVWVQYLGTLRTDGTVTVSSALFSPNTIGKTENKVRNKSEFDAAAVDEGDRQGAFSKFVKGLDAKRIPAYKDAAMQSRVERIGNKLIPAYQRALPIDDSTRIDFRFQLVDQTKMKDSITLPSGIILVPYQVVQALPDDAQLAAVLASDIAEVMEKQEVRAIPAKNKMLASSIAGSIGGLFVPGLGLAESIGNAKAQSVLEHHQMEQSGRTSLTFMHDAGYDIRQAPLAWWTLGDKNKKGLASVRLPYRTQYLYRVLATAWAKEPL